MKANKSLLLAFIACVSVSCNNNDGEASTADSTAVTTTTVETAPEATPAVPTTGYMDLVSGRTVTRDEASGRFMDESGNAAEFYVDLGSHDTFYAPSGQNVNNALVNDNGSWHVDDAKIKIKDDKVKMKTDDQKIKMKDADDDGSGKFKVKDK